jgi:hypothetical protein
MSLRPSPLQPVPEETVRIAQAAFPAGNSYLTSHLSPPAHGRPTPNLPLPRIP